MTIKFIKPVEEESTPDNVPRETIQDTTNETPSIGANDIIKQVIEGEKKKPGRKKKNAVPLDVAPLVSEQKETKTAANATKKYTQEFLSNQVFGIHAMLDIVIKDTAITKLEADMMGKAMFDVMEAFDVVISPKVMSMLGLIATMGIVEVPVLLRVRKNALTRSSQQIAVMQVKQESPKPLQLVHDDNDGIAVGKPM